MAWQRPGRPYGTILRVHDGDTPIMELDLGLDVWRRGDLEVRLAISSKLWINAAELKTPGGDAAAANLQAMLPVGSIWDMRTFSWDAYKNRVDADLYFPDGSSLSQWLVDHNWAAAYNGQGPAPLPPWPRPIMA